MLNGRGSWVQHAIMFYCIWCSRDLIGFYRYTPFDPWAWIPLILWLMPCLCSLIKGRIQNTFSEGFFLSAGLILSLLGTVVQINAVKYLGLTCAFATYSPWMGWSTYLWLFSAASWMPALGYFFGQKISITLLRFILISFSFPLFYQLGTKQKEPIWEE